MGRWQKMEEVMVVKKIQVDERLTGHARAVKQQVVHDQKPGQPFEVSQSTIKNWRRCHALYDYRYVQLLERRRPILQLIRGTMIGKCLDAIALARVVAPKGSPSWRKVLEPFRKQYAKMFAAEKELYGDPVVEVERIIERYEQVYADDGLDYGSVNEIAPFELPIKVELAPGIAFTGHIDKMPRDKQGRIWDMDHKSHKNIPDAEHRFSDLQQVFYQWAAPLSGYPKLTGVIWDYLRTKPPVVPEELKDGGLSQRKNMDTDHDTYMAEIKRLKLNPKDYQKMLVPLKARGHMDFYLRVQLPSPSPVLVKNVVEEARTTAIEMKRVGGVDKTRSIAYDCARCEYYNLCQAELRGLDSSFIRKSEYQINKTPRHVHLNQDSE